MQEYIRHGAEESVSEAVGEEDDLTHQSNFKDFANNEANFDDTNTGDSIKKPENTEYKISHFNYNDNQVLRSLISYCRKYQNDIQGQFSDCLRKNNFGKLWSSKCIGTNCIQQYRDIMNSGINKRNWLCGRHGCHSRKKRFACNRYKCGRSVKKSWNSENGLIDADYPRFPIKRNVFCNRRICGLSSRSTDAFSTIAKKVLNSRKEYPQPANTVLSSLVQAFLKKHTKEEGRILNNDYLQTNGTNANQMFNYLVLRAIVGGLCMGPYNCKG